jgi:hypothetical protein
MSKRKADLNYENKENEGVEAKKTRNNNDPLRTLKDINKNTISEKNKKEDQIKTIKMLLKEIKPSCHHSVAGKAHELNANIGLNVNNFGDIQLPLDETQAEELIKVCKQASYGQKLDTLYDTTVRGTYQLEPSEFEIKNQEWNENLSKLVERVAKELGCKGQVTSSLYKLLLYKQGGHFKKHRDSEKKKGMFGKLIIQLPSIFTGCELVLYEENLKKVVNFAEATAKCPKNIYYAAHCADVEHEILEVKSGYRLALIYSLCWLNGNDDTLNKESLTNQMTSALASLDKSGGKLGFFLDHRYTSQSFETYGLKALKGIDNDRYCLLKNASDRLPSYKQLNFFALRAYLTLNTELSDDDEFGDETENVHEHDYGIEQVFDANGNSYEKDELEISLNHFTEIIDLNKPVDQVTKILDSDSWDMAEQNEDYTGNEGVVLKTPYQKYVLAIMPIPNGVRSACSSRLEAENFLGSLEVDRIPKDDAKFVNDFKSLINFLMSQYEKKKERIHLNDDHYIKILSILLVLDEADLDLVNACLNKIMFGFSSANAKLFAKLIRKHGYEQLKQGLKLHIKSANCYNMKLVYDLLEVFVYLINFNRYIF